MMQIVIDIPEEEYEEIINSEDSGLHRLTRAIANGTPLEQEPCEELDFVQPHKKIPVNLNVCKMREATQEEREGIERYIDSIAEPCDDCISRQAVLDGLASIAKAKAKSDAQKSLMGRVMFFTEQLPSVTPQPQTGWIPVSERLPEESLNSVIGWDTYRERCVFVQYIDGHFQITGSNESFNIVAWMPLPSPYKAESEEV